MEGYRDTFNILQAHVKLPNTILISVLLFFGVAGNTMVLFVYKLKLKSIRKERFFIPAIALTDLTACVLGGTLTILRNTYTASFPSNALCKGLWYMTGCVSGISALLLTIIAISRYFKICEPTKTVRFLQNIKLTVKMTAVCAALAGIPLIFLHGLRPFDFKVFNNTVTGFSCSDIEISTSSLKILKYVYNALLLSMLISTSIVICVMYARIGQLIYRRFRILSQKQVRSTNVVPDRPSDTSGHHESPFTVEPISLLTQTIQTNTDITEFTSPVNLATSATNRKRRSIRRRRKRTRNNFTYMFICVTFTSIATYLPSVAFFIIPGENPNTFWMELSPVKLNIFLTLSKMYMFAHASNPFTYLYFDLDFRRALVDLIQKGKGFILRNEV